MSIIYIYIYTYILPWSSRHDRTVLYHRHRDRTPDAICKMPSLTDTFDAAI